MATKFWVGGGATTNWNATGNTNWANSSGGAGNQTGPGTGDLVVFDSASGTANSVLNTAYTIQGLSCDGTAAGANGAYGGTLTHNTSTTLTINTGSADSLRFASGMTYTPATTTSLITLTHTTGTANIKSYGKQLAALTINSVGGTTQTLDELRVDAVNVAALTLTAGTLDFNGGSGGPFPVRATSFILNANNTRTLILGGTVTLGGSILANILWNVANTGTLTFTKNSANMVILACSGAAQPNFTGGGLTYNDLTLNATTQANSLWLTGANTFAHLTIGTGWSVLFPGGATNTISNAFAWAGSIAQPMLIGSQGPNQTATISCPSGSCTLAYGGLAGVATTGGATFTATNCFDFKGIGNVTFLNSGWSISPPADATAVLTAAEVTTLGKMIDGVACGTVTTGASTTSVPTSALSFNGVAATGVVADEFKGRVIEFSGATTTAGLRGAVSAISASTASNTPTFTVAALPATPASGDLFCII